MDATTSTYANATTEPAELPYEEQPDYLRAQNLWIYGSPVIIILGTIGNVLSALVMMRKSLRTQTTGLYLVVLAVVDTTVLYTGLLRYWVRALSGTDVRTFSPASCKIHIFLVYFLLQYEAWVLVSVALERFFAIFTPLKAKQLFTKKFAVIQMSAIAAVLAAINLHFFFTHTIIEDVYCYVSAEKHEPFVFEVMAWLDFCLASLAPFVLMLSCNVAIIARLMYLNHQRKKNLNIKNDVKMTSMTAILLTINFVFFLTTAPIALYLSTQQTWYDRVETWADVARLDLVWASMNILAYTNNAINFVLYCLSGPRFRRELVRMLGLQRLGRRVQPYPATENSATVNVEMNTQVQEI